MSPEERVHASKIAAIYTLSQIAAGYCLWRHQLFAAIIAWGIGIGYIAYFSGTQPPTPRPPNTFWGGPSARH